MWVTEKEGCILGKFNIETGGSDKGHHAWSHGGSKGVGLCGVQETLAFGGWTCEYFSPEDAGTLRGREKWG